jgi:STIP1 homology and U-box containing protein 1
VKKLSANFFLPKMTKEKAAEHKALGNKDFQAKNFESAIKHFTNAIEEDDSDHVFFSNR